jgi:hypothetical protein
MNKETPAMQKAGVSLCSDVRYNEQRNCRCAPRVDTIHTMPALCIDCIIASISASGIPGIPGARHRWPAAFGAQSVYARISD